MTLQKYAVKYSECSYKELKAFILARTGKGAPTRNGETFNKSYLTSILDKLDEEIIFRFIDLAPELRNLIYVELLTWSENARGVKHYCSPQILATCKQIHEEAADIIYAENVGEVEVLLNGAYSLGLAVDGHRICAGEYRSEVTQLIGEIPLYFQKLHHIKLSVYVDRFALEAEEPDSIDVRAQVSRTTNHVLYFLSHFLVQSNKMKSFELHLVTETTVIEVEKLADILSPLANLQLPSSAITMHGPLGLEDHQWRSQWASGAYSRASDMLDDYIATNAALERYEKLICDHVPGDVAVNYSAKTNALDSVGERQAEIDNLMESHQFIVQASEDEIQNLLRDTNTWLAEEAIPELEMTLNAETSAVMETIRDAMG